MRVRSLHLRTHRRRPVRLPGYAPGEDVQGDIPWNWCDRCGCEVFTPAARLCLGCDRRNDDGSDAISL